MHIDVLCLSCSPNTVWTRSFRTEGNLSGDDRKKVRVQGKHKKQSGGHGQYCDVWSESSRIKTTKWSLRRTCSAQRAENYSRG
jgi:hypothetical protein